MFPEGVSVIQTEQLKSIAFHVPGVFGSALEYCKKNHTMCLPGNYSFYMDKVILLDLNKISMCKNWEWYKYLENIY